MKTIYLVRHGESEGNAGPVRIGYKGGLTEKGRSQARELALRCAKLPIDLIVSSTLQRAKETTEEILKKVNAPVEYSDLFIERRNPTAIIGLKKDTPEEMLIVKSIWENFHRSEWHFSDEENFDDLKKRGLQALAYLTSRKEDHILVSGHGIFMRIIAACMLFDEELTGSECSAIMSGFKTNNSGITVCQYNKGDSGRWRIRVWNDHAHLG